MIYGIDYLGGASYSRLVLANHPPGWAAGFFANTFGDALPVVQKLSESGTCPLIRVHLLWSDTHNFNRASITAAKKEAARFNGVKGHARIELSPFCEHNLPAPGPMLDAVAKAAPACTIVNTPYRGSLNSTYKLEVHGLANAVGNYPNNYSFDGTDALAGGIKDRKAHYSSAEVFFLWTPLLNLKRDVSDKTPRGQRTVRPTPETISSLKRLVS